MFFLIYVYNSIDLKKKFAAFRLTISLILLQKVVPNNCSFFRLHKNQMLAILEAIKVKSIANFKFTEK